ncbi:pentraxin fusion protein-like isoform X2 [Pyxicephalus adspersus]
MNLAVSLLLFGFLVLVQCCDPKPGAVNLARDGKASQSSDYSFRVMGYADQAIDGRAESNYHKGSCTHTNNDYEPWWHLDLEQNHKISTIIITNRGDCWAKRLLGAEVRIGNSPDRNNPVCGHVTDVSQPRISMCCNGMEGRYVSVLIPGRAEYLTLCELEVYGAEEVDGEHHVCW